MSAVLEARGVAAGHGGTAVVAGVDFSLGAGQVLCLLGPNGGGKTTLLRTLLGLLPPVAGQVLSGGQPLAALSRGEVARRLAHVPQAGGGGFAYPAREVVAMGLAARLPLLSGPGRRDMQQAEAALDRLGIAQLAPRPVTQLSGGERQLVLIARALVQQAPCLILDEPTAALDFGNQVMVLERLRALAAEGQAILFTTHHPDHAFLLAERVAMIHGGAWHGPEAPEAMITPERLRAAYGVGAMVRRLEGRAVVLPLLNSTSS